MMNVAIAFLNIRPFRHAPWWRLQAFALVAALVMVVIAQDAGRNALAAAGWAELPQARFRLISASLADNEGRARTYAGLQIQLDKGWKTYWRNPGAAGGIPPQMDFSASKNLARATVLYPAPTRFPGSYGDTIGYKSEVVFPILIEPLDPARPVELDLKLYIGVCSDICVPVDREFSQRIATSTSGASTPFAPLISRHLSRVPGHGGPAPEIVARKAVIDGASPYLQIDVHFPGKAASADLFLEVDDAIHVPAPEVFPQGDGSHYRFRVDLTKSEDPALFKGRTLRLTMVSENAQGEATWTLD